MGKLKPGNRTAITRFQLKPPLFLDDALGATDAHAAASHFSPVCATRITVWNFESISMRPFYVARAEAWWKPLAGAAVLVFAFLGCDLVCRCPNRRKRQAYVSSAVLDLTLATMGGRGFAKSTATGSP
jgi:hypothetical protein